jgi:hypothetical protein
MPQTEDKTVFYLHKRYQNERRYRVDRKEKLPFFILAVFVGQLPE